MARTQKSAPSLMRHSRDCGLCAHSKRDQIEREFVAWESPTRIAKKYRLQRSTIYLHAAAFGLIELREKNTKGALAKYIERCDRVRPSAAAFVSAVVALSKINAEGQTVDRVAVSNVMRDFGKFTRGELDDFARNGTLPAWYGDRDVTASPGGEL